MHSTSEVLRALLEHHKLRHKSFALGEYVYIDANYPQDGIVDQDGSSISGLDYLDEPETWSVFDDEEYSWADLCMAAEGTYVSEDGEIHLEFKPNDGGLYCINDPNIPINDLSTLTYYRQRI